MPVLALFLPQNALHESSACTRRFLLTILSMQDAAPAIATSATNIHPAPVPTPSRNLWVPPAAVPNAASPSEVPSQAHYPTHQPLATGRDVAGLNMVQQPLADPQLKQAPVEDDFGMPLPPLLHTVSTEGSADPRPPSYSQGLCMTTASQTVTASQMSSDVTRSTTTITPSQGLAPPVQTAPPAPVPSAVPPMAGARGFGTAAKRRRPSDPRGKDTKRTDARGGTGGVEAPAEDTFDMVHTVATQLPPPPLGAPAEQHMEFLHQQLDSMGLEKPLLEGLVLLGDNERLQGGEHSSFSPCIGLFSMTVKSDDVTWRVYVLR